MKYLFILLLLISFSVKSQNVDQYVISNFGLYQENTNTSISSTLGEIAIKTLTSTDFILTQGFQQGAIKVNTLIDEKDFTLKIKVYPNPVTHSLIIESDKESLYELYNINGQKILTINKSNPTEIIDFSNYSSGIYLLKINNQETHKIIKQ